MSWTPIPRYLQMAELADAPIRIRCWTSSFCCTPSPRRRYRPRWTPSRGPGPCEQAQLVAARQIVVVQSPMHVAFAAVYGAVYAARFGPDTSYVPYRGAPPRPSPAGPADFTWSSVDRGRPANRGAFDGAMVGVRSAVLGPADRG
jgi:hypothetical protein